MSALPTPATNTRTRRKDERPAELLQAALELFSEKGYSSTRAEEIAKRAGVSKGTLFLYFGTKEELFEAVVKQAVVPVLHDAQKFAKDFSGTATELITALIRLWWQRSASTQARAIPNMLISEAHHFPHCATYYEEEVLQPCRQLVYDAVERGVASGEFRPVDMGLLWLSFHSLLTYPSIWEKAVRSSRSALLCESTNMEAFIEQHCAILLRGLHA
jgi:TetR/AcrR family transcriptional regulator